MKLKALFLLAIVLTLTISSHAQRGVRIGYIDTEFILENIPEYQEATAQLDSKVQKWKTEIDGRLGEIEQRRKDLSNEKALLTEELVKEREEDITFDELEILDYQQKRFGPNGDLMIQKRQLIQPIQDQIFAAVQDIASTKKFDFIFDKSADVVMLYSADRFDLSEQVIRAINRSSKRSQANSRKERKDAEEEDVVPEVNEELDERKKALEDKKAERAAAAEQRRQEILAEREAKQQAAQRRRDSIINARQQAREERLRERQEAANSDTDQEETPDETEEINDTEEVNDNDEQDAPSGERVSDGAEENPEGEEVAQPMTDRERRQQELEERRQRILEERRKAKEERDRAKNNTEEEDTGGEENVPENENEGDPDDDDSGNDTDE